MCDLVNHTHIPKEDHLPDWARLDNKVTKGDRAEYHKEYSLYGLYEFPPVQSSFFDKFTWVAYGRTL